MFIKEIKRSVINIRFLGVVILSVIFMFLSSKDSSWGNVIGNTSDLTSSQLETLKEIYLNRYLIWSKGYFYIKSLFPLAIGLPYIYSYVCERENNASLFIKMRSGIKKYNFSKFLAGGISGALVLALPELIYNLLILLFARNEVSTHISLEPIYWKNHLIQMSLNTRVYFTIGMHLLFGFSFACFAQGISTFFKNKISVYFGLFGIYLIYDIIVTSIVNIPYISITNTYDVLYQQYNIFSSLIVMLVMVIIGSILFKINEIKAFMHA